ncbi:MAG: ribonuclease M5 [Erysipelotrichaceae bacterium]
MKIKQVIVVEGKHDSDTLKKYFDCDTIETQGTYLSNATLEMIRQTQQKRGIIIFTDPDVPGNKIRERINQSVPHCQNAFIEKALAKTTKKVGIEHASKADLQNALKHVITYQEHFEESLSQGEFLALGLNGQPHSKALRQQVGNLLFLGEANAKTLFKRLNMLQIDKDTLETIIKELP